MSIPELARILSRARFVWWIAGGHALDLVLDRTTRHHDDLDVEVLRRDQHQAQHLLTGLGWDLHVAADGRLRPWCPGQWLTTGDNSVWCRPATDEPWCLQLMLADSDNNNWRFRRNPAIIRPIESIGRHTTSGVPYLDPTIQLLFKANLPALKTPPTSTPCSWHYPAPTAHGWPARWTPPTQTIPGWHNCAAIQTNNVSAHVRLFTAIRALYTP
ncbi:MAG TPA: amino acid transporter [Pseudonocardiaceae bacterium]|nr:amino acid transporter [Pseudonocardiaceae bacterium]